MSMYPDWDRQSELSGSIGKLLTTLGKITVLPPRLAGKYALVHAKATLMMATLDETAAKLLPQMQNVEALASELLEEINNQ